MSATALFSEFRVRKKREKKKQSPEELCCHLKVHSLLRAGLPPLIPLAGNCSGSHLLSVLSWECSSRNPLTPGADRLGLQKRGRLHPPRTDHHISVIQEATCMLLADWNPVPQGLPFHGLSGWLSLDICPCVGLLDHLEYESVIYQDVQFCVTEGLDHQVNHALMLVTDKTTEQGPASRLTQAQELPHFLSLFSWY